LDNNIICKIQKLDHLVNLEWLDLSFNLIEQIEGLGNLTKLTDLSLYSNKIKRLSGLENLCNLNVLSFGKNLITKYADDEDGCINYLRTLKNKLEVLKMAENRFTNSGQTEGDYKLYAIEALKKLKYIDYELISEQQREAAKQKYSDELQEKDNQNKDDEDREVDPELVKAHIDVTIGMLKTIEDADADNSYFLKKLKDQPNLWQQLDS
jgi:Leucine-rich repeat (LRR) protein